MSVNFKKSKLISGKDINEAQVGEIIPLELVEEFKYLGAEFEIKPSKFFQEKFSETCVKKSSMYRGSTISLASKSPDPVLFAKRLWTACALPGILYGSEVQLLKSSSLNKIAVQQHRVARYILQVPSKTTNAAAQHALGMKHIKVLYYERVLKYFCKIRDSPYNSLINRAYRTMKELGFSSHYWRHVMGIKGKIGWNGDSDTVSSCIMNYCIKEANKAKSDFTKTMFVFPLATKNTFKHTMPHLDYSSYSEITNRFILLNAGLGNRKPLKDGRQFKNCPLCSEKLNEVHLLLSCEPLEPIRKATGIRKLMNKWVGLSDEEMYKNFWNLWSISKDTKNNRAHAAGKMLETYLQAINI